MLPAFNKKRLGGGVPYEGRNVRFDSRLFGSRVVITCFYYLGLICMRGERLTTTPPRRSELDFFNFGKSSRPSSANHYYMYIFSLFDPYSGVEKTIYFE